MFGADMSWSTKIDVRKKDILILVKGPTQGLEQVLKKCNWLIQKKISFVWVCIMIEKIVTYLLMASKLLNLNQKFLK